MNDKHKVITFTKTNNKELIVMYYKLQKDLHRLSILVIQVSREEKDRGMKEKGQYQ